MYRKTGFLVLAFLAMSGLLMAGGNPKSLSGETQIGFLQTAIPPDLRCIGGEPTNLPFPYLPCSEGTRRVLARSEEQIWFPAYLSDSIAALLDGELKFVVNCNMNASYRGPCWGTFEWTVPGVGVWEGTWTTPVMDLLTYESKLSMVGQGVGSEIDGKQLKVDGGSAPWDYYITADVRIK